MRRHLGAANYALEILGARDEKIFLKKFFFQKINIFVKKFLFQAKKTSSDWLEKK